jgi:AcrR family transcriptional regulator
MSPTAVTEKGEETRRRILDVAAAAFARNGYAGTSLNDLIRETGLTKGGFYFHFASKEALAVEVCNEQRAERQRRVLESLEQGARAIDQLAQMVWAVTDQFKAADAQGLAIDVLCAELADDPRLGPLLAGSHGRWIELTADLIRRGQEEGDVRGDVDPQAFAEIAVASYLGVCRLPAAEWNADVRTRVEQFVTFLLTALRPAG